MNSDMDLLASEKIEQQRKATEQRFQKLSAQWKQETLYLSNVVKKALHPAYQGIIGLGEPAVPLILEELKWDPADWFWALTAITGANPVPESSAGKVAEMAEAWLGWGRERVLIA